jgi:hypothetical protein
MCSRAGIATVRRNLPDRRTGGYPRESLLEPAGPGTGDYPGRSAGLVSADRLRRVDDVGCLP